MRYFLLGCIFVLGFLLRVVAIDKYPVGFTPDEASFGYDAYSILKTGKDQWGNILPLVLKSFGDYKSPLYAYLAIPSVAVLGLSEFATRLPNALLGSLSVLVLYLLTKQLFKEEIVALIAALILAVSPWHIMLSRGAFEANLITFFLPLGIYLFLKEYYLISGTILGLNLFTYHSAKLITPIIFIALIYFFRSKIKKTWPSLIIFLVFFLGLIYSFFLGGLSRVAERSITEGALEEGAKVKIELINQGANPVLAKLMHNKYQVVANRFLSNYFEYFSPKFLFTQGAAETTYGMLPGIGVIYGVEGLLFIGLVQIIKNKRYRWVALSILGWLLISPVPAALATGVGYSANRAISMLPSVQILGGLGFLGWREFLTKFNQKVNIFSMVVILLVIFFSFFNFMYSYFRNSPKIAARGMLYGNLDAAKWLGSNANGKELIVSKSISEPHIYIAFAQVWDPSGYQIYTKSWNLKSWVDQIPVYKLGNYTFTNEHPNLGRPYEFKGTDNIDKVFYYPDGEAVLYAKIK